MTLIKFTIYWVLDDEAIIMKSIEFPNFRRVRFVHVHVRQRSSLKAPCGPHLALYSGSPTEGQGPSMVPSYASRFRHTMSILHAHTSQFGRSLRLVSQGLVPEYKRHILFQHPLGMPFPEFAVVIRAHRKCCGLMTSRIYN